MELAGRNKRGRPKRFVDVVKEETRLVGVRWKQCHDLWERGPKCRSEVQRFFIKQKQKSKPNPKCKNSRKGLSKTQRSKTTRQTRKLKGKDRT